MLWRSCSPWLHRRLVSRIRISDPAVLTDLAVRLARPVIDFPEWHNYVWLGVVDPMRRGSPPVVCAETRVTNPLLQPENLQTGTQGLAARANRQSI